MTILAELGDLTRFNSRRELVGFLGLAPGRVLVQLSPAPGSDHQDVQLPRPSALGRVAWVYRYSVRKTAHLRRTRAMASDRVQAIA